MAIDWTRLEEAKKAAQAQGFDPRLIESAVGKLRSEEEGFNIDTDEGFQEWWAKEQVKQKIEDQGELENIEEEAKYFANLGDLATPEEYEKLSLGTKSRLKDTGYTPPKKLSDADQKKLDASSTIKLAAKNVLDVLDQINSGQLTGDAARENIEQVAGNAAKGAFEEAGKQFTGMEWALVSGTIPEIKLPWQPPGIQKFLIGGREKTPTGELTSAETRDNYAQLRRKMELAIQLADQQEAKARGEEIPDVDVAKLSGQISQLKEQKQNTFMSLIADNWIRSAKGYASLLKTAAVAATSASLGRSARGVEALGFDRLSSGLKGTSLALAESIEETVKNKYASRGQALLVGSLELLGGVGTAFDLGTLGQAAAGKTLVRSALATGFQATKIGARNMMINAPIYGLGEAIKAEKQGGDAADGFVRGMTGKGFTGPFEAIYGETQEAKTADMVASVVVPIVGAKMLTKFIDGTVMKDPDIRNMSNKVKNIFGDKASQPSETLPDIEESKAGYLESKARKSALKVVRPGLTAKEQGSMVDITDDAINAIKATKSRSTYSISEELPKLNKSSGKYIEKTLANLDNTNPIPIRQQATLPGDIKGIIKETDAFALDIKESSKGQTKPIYDVKFEPQIDSLLTPKPGEMLTLSKINDARKALNKSIPSSWFRGGMLIKNTSDQLYSMRWSASLALRDFLTSTTGAENVGKALNLQHLAMSTGPVFSRLHTKVPSSRGGGFFGFGINILGHSFKAILEWPTLGFIRKFGGSEINSLPPIPTNTQVPPIPQQPQLSLPAPGGGGLPDIKKNKELNPIWMYK